MQIEKLNSQSGIVLILSIMWLFTLCLIMAFGIWVIKERIEPTNPIVTGILGVLIGTAFGSVNGALFTSMTGEVPSQSNNTTVVQQKTTQTSESSNNQPTTQQAPATPGKTFL
jgi:tellurite resistance protein TehA-like permease